MSTIVEVDFKVFKDAVKAQFELITSTPANMVRMGVSKDDLWDTYLNSFPEGTNNLFRERREYDCNCCKQFVCAVGNAAVLTDDGPVSVWDVEVPYPFNVVAKALADMVRNAPIQNVFRHYEGTAGTDVSRAEYDGNIVTFNHFHAVIPRPLQDKDPASMMSDKRSTYGVFRRGLEELTTEAVETVIELIGQNSLYRGAEFLPMVESFYQQKKAYMELTTDREKEIYAWRKGLSISPSAARIRNSAIGTLLVNLSEDMELDTAVSKYEKVVAPLNYKRPTALVTASMIKRAEQTVSELGYMDSLQRRHAVTEDITVNNVLFADRSAKKHMKNVFEELAEEARDSAVNVKTLDKVEEMTADAFVANVLPTAESVDVLVENRHTPSLFTLLAPVNKDARNMLKWDNNFSWSYAGEVADSIKERVKAAGGSVTGALRCSLAWHNGDDLDLHMIEPNGNRIYHGDKRSRTGGFLDIDMNAGGPTNPKDPVENITYPNEHTMPHGTYKLLVNQYHKRSGANIGFTVEMEFKGELKTFTYDKPIDSGHNVEVVVFTLSASGIKIVRSLPESSASKEVWGINTQQYHKVRMVMNSPNHWDDKVTGNKHLFFVLDGCRKKDATRGFYNEFLTDDLKEHRKVFEMLGAKMKAPESEDQLSGLGFSSTQRNHVFCRIKGAFERVIKVTF